MNNLYWIIVILFVLFLMIRGRIKKRGYFWKAKDGTKLSFKEFLKRWKDGIEGITPVQQAKTQLMGLWITLTGIITGLIINVLIRIKPHWIWIEIVLAGSFIVTGTSMIGSYQTYKIKKRVENSMRKLMEKKNVKKVRTAKKRG